MSSTITGWCRIVAGACAFAPAGLAQEAPREAPQEVVLRDVVIRNRDVFDDDEAAQNLIYMFANGLHATTGSEVVRREVFVEPGDVITAEQVAELERNLRAMGLFGAVEVDLRDVGDGEADLDIKTRDRFSLLFALTGASVGGVTKVSGVVGESNLFGTGKRLALSGSRESEYETYTLTYQDPQLFGSWYQLGTWIGETSEGQFGYFDVRRPFKHLADPWSYGVAGGGAARAVDYYVAGDIGASVPEDRQDLSAFVAHAYGPRDLRMRAGVDVAYGRSDFGVVRGDRPDLVEVPADHRVLQLGVSGGFDWNDSFLIEQRIDAIDYDEDIRLGASLTARAALAARDQDGVGGELQPLFSLESRTSARVLPETFATLELEGGARLAGGAAVAWRSRAALHLFQTSLPQQTLAASVRFDHVEDQQGLAPQLTLGEDNGLRGYPARQFAADRLWLVNLEDRIDTGIELWSVHLGLVAFADIGWIPDPEQGLTLSDPLRSVGVGLRLGSSELLGSNVFRLDVAVPLDDVGVNDFGVSISASAGQVFEFFGSAAGLNSEFEGFFR